MAPSNSAFSAAALAVAAASASAALAFFACLRASFSSGVYFESIGPLLKITHLFK